MGKFKDLTGLKYDSLTALERTGNHGKKTRWRCRCDCGNIVIVAADQLVSGHTKSCGCKSRVDYTGMKIGRLLVVGAAGRDGGGRQKWLCRCDCGKDVIYRGCVLRDGQATSCGCGHIKIKEGHCFGRLTTVELVIVKNKRKWVCICDCGNKAVVSVDKLLSGHTKSCGCYRVDYLKAHAGPESYNWNPDLTQEDRESRRLGQRNKEWSLSVMRRDIFTCQICGCNRRLNAHHLDGYHWAKALRFDISNGVTLCETCHRQYHILFGKKNSTKEKFDLFYRFVKCMPREQEVVL